MSGSADVSPSHMARVLLDAESQGDPAASRTHSVSTRTIRRWRLDARAGRFPEVAALVQAGREEALRQSVDAFSRAQKAVLESLAAKAREPSASLSDLTAATKVLLEHAANRAIFEYLDDARLPLPASKAEVPSEVVQ